MRQNSFPFLGAWFGLGLLTVISLVFLTPPFQVPDEAQHFFRAYQISEGKLIGDVENGASGGLLPSSLSVLVTHFLGSTAMHADKRPVKAQPLSETLPLLSQPLAPDVREFTIFSGAASYSPLAYLPQAIALKVGRLFAAGPLALLYMARLANGLVALAILFQALRLLPVGRELAGFAALLPMAALLYASVSADALVISSAFLFTALMLNRIVTDGWTSGDMAVALASALVFCTLKPTYAPLLLLGFAQVFFTRNRTAAVWRHAAILGVTLVATALWLRYSAQAIVLMKSDTSLPGQIAYIVQDPLRHVMTVAHSLYWEALLYYRQLIGVLGWLNVFLPAAAYLLPLPALLLALGSEAHMLSKRTTLLLSYCCAIGAGCVLLIMTALYLYWTPVGHISVEGVQGRYFLPLLPLGIGIALWTPGRKALWSKNVAGAGMLVLIGLEIGMMLFTISRSYSVF